MKGEVFIDSGAFIAFLVPQDSAHEDVRSLFGVPPRRWWTSSLVIAETYGWFLHRINEEAARAFRRLLDAMPRLGILSAGPAHHGAVGARLDNLRGYKLTYVDASSLVWLKRRDIHEVYGTDQHLALEGAEVRPGSSR